MIRSLALYLDFEGTKNINILYILIWGLENAGGSCHGDLDLDKVSGFINLCFESWLSILILKAQSTYISFQPCCGDLKDTGGTRLQFGIFILIWIWSLVFDTPMFQILALYLDFEGAKNIHVL